jgi:drug/metabolite transporter (DMT)-like permease
LNLLGPGEILSVSSGVLWAVAVVLYKVAGDRVPSLVLNLGKGIVSLLIFLPLLLLLGGDGNAWTPAVWGRLALSGFLGITLADTLFFMALDRLGAGMNAVVDCLYSPFFALLSYLVLAEQQTAWVYVGGTLIVSAVVVGSVTRPAPGRTHRDLVVGMVLGAIGMLLLPASIVLIKPILEGDSALAATTWRLVVGTGALAPLVLLGPDRKAFAALLRPSRTWRTFLPASVIGGAFAMWAWVEGFRLMEKTTLSALLNQLSTIWIFVLAGLFLSEPFTRRRVAAIAIAFGGVVLITLG